MKTNYYFRGLNNNYVTGKKIGVGLYFAVSNYHSKQNPNK